MLRSGVCRDISRRKDNVVFQLKLSLRVTLEGFKVNDQVIFDGEDRIRR